MSYYNINLLLTIILAPSLVLIPIVFSKSQDSEIACFCSDTSGSYYPHSNYEQSLTYLVDNLCANAPINNGFHKANWSEGDTDTNRAYGLANCRGDVSNEDCKACLVNATISVNNNTCPYRKGAIIWRDYCQLKYSDVDFLGIYDEAVDYKYSRENERSTYILPVSNLLSNLMNNIDENTLFGHRSTTVEIGYHYDNIYLYGMVQCTRDLSRGNCTRCLRDAIKEISTDRVGAILLYGSCNVRYETYKFINN
ncbi:hypothetical protein CASFOL_031355 [Castilleja foliolosa]|uniref:Gnk2-homologous domain-containing protein n=1 Tax=Castilleja foliolosa TaxID=1961234 RepID=A0ABD3C560_9LAMI